MSRSAEDRIKRYREQTGYTGEMYSTNDGAIFVSIAGATKNALRLRSGYQVHKATAKKKITQKKEKE